MTLRPTRSVPVRLLAVAGVAALGLGLAGCSGSDDADGKASASASASATERPAITDVETPAGGDGDYVGAVKDVQVTSCKKADGAWKVVGTVENPEKSAQGYRIYVSLLKGQSDTRAVTEVDVASVGAGDSADWDTTIDTDESGLSCVLRVERFAA
uniref:Lipoprotein n=1 Tax=Neobacillus citreus TaxID=2833578 RepID=A0A942SZ38_9BACI